MIVAVLIVLAIAGVVWLFTRAGRDSLIRCPVCGSTKLAALPDRPLQLFSTAYMCEHGHEFRTPVEGP